MNNKIKYIFVILLGLIILSNLSFAVTRAVNGSGPACDQAVGVSTFNYTTIQSAVGNSSAGDTIIVCANGTGGYRENVVAGVPLNIYGNQSNVNVTAASGSADVFEIQSSYTNISNFSVSGATDTGEAGIVIISGADYSKSTNNTAYNCYWGMSTQGAKNTTFISNTVYNISSSAFQIYQGDNNTINSNLIANNSGNGLSISQSSNNVVNSNTVYNSSWGIYAHSNSENNTFTSNTVYLDDAYGFYIIANYNNLSLNTAYNNTNQGFYVAGNSSNLINNTAYDNEDSGFEVAGAYFNVLINNTAYDNDKSGLAISSGSNNNTLTSNTAYNNTKYGFNIASSNNTILTKNTAYNNSNGGFYLTNNIANTTLTNNTAYGHPGGYGGFFFDDFYDCKLYNNTAYDNIYGIMFYTDCTTDAFEGNNITNATEYALYMGPYSNITFTGNNGIYEIPSEAHYVYASELGISTSSYNITTTNMSFGLGSSFNISIRVVDLSNLSLTTVSTITGVSISSGKVVENSYGNYYGLNVTNLSATASFSPKLYYNSSDVTSTTYLGIGATSSGGTWTYYSPTTLNTGATSIYKSGITSFSYFAPLVYTPLPATSSSGDSTSSYEVEVSHEFDCETGEVVVSVTSGGSAASGVTATLMGVSFGYSSSESTDSEGAALFTITSDGTYKILTAATDSYLAGSESDFSLALCETEEEEEPEEEPPVEEPEEEEQEGEEQIEVPEEEPDEEPPVEKPEEEEQEGEEPAAPSEESSGETGEPEGEEEQDYSWMYLLGLVILVVVLVGGYFLLKGKKK